MQIGAIHHVTALAVNNSPGPGPLMRTVIVCSVVGVVVLAWIVLRGYTNND